MPRSTRFRIRRQGGALLRGRAPDRSHYVDELTAITEATLDDQLRRRSAQSVHTPTVPVDSDKRRRGSTTVVACRLSLSTGTTRGLILRSRHHPFIEHDHALLDGMQDLVDADDLDGALLAATPEQVAAAWCCYARRGARSDEDPDWWAVQLWIELYCEHRPEREDLLRRGLLALIDAAPSDDVLGLIGAGPLEQLVCTDEGRVSWIEAEAARSARFRTALRSVWTTGLPDDVVRRVEQAAR